MSANDGGQGRLELPVNEPITRVFDSSNVPGVKYRLELVNTKVSLWWVFFSGIHDGGPPTEIVLGHCPRLIPSLIAYNLQGTLTLPSPWPAQPDGVSDLTIGNLTLKSIGQPVHTWCWGLYLSGEKTDVVLQGTDVHLRTVSVRRQVGHGRGHRHVQRRERVHDGGSGAAERDGPQLRRESRLRLPNPRSRNS